MVLFADMTPIYPPTRRNNNKASALYQRLKRLFKEVRIPRVLFHSPCSCEQIYRKKADYSSKFSKSSKSSIEPSMLPSMSE